MNTTPVDAQAFQYITRPGSSAQIITAPKYRGTKTSEEVYAEVQRRLGTTAPTVQSVIKTFHEVVIDWCKQSWKIEPIEDLLGYAFSSGGSEDDADFHPTFDSLNITPNCRWGDVGHARAAVGFSAENVGHQGRVIPVITRVTDNWTGQPDHYTPGKSVLIELGNRKGVIEFKHANGSKVQFKKADGTLVEASDYGESRRTRITAQVPSGTTGVLSVVVTMMINGSLRTGEYPLQLAQS